MSTSLEPDFVVLPPNWHGRGGDDLLAGDLTHFAPQGLALAPPAIVTPYSGPPAASYYGAQGTITHPIKSAPLNDDTGGLVYFSSHIPPVEIVAALDLFGFRSQERAYAIFLAAAQNPSEDNFLDQMRIVSHAGLAHFYHVDTKALAPQSLDSGQAVARFMEWQKEKWGEDSGAYTLAGCLGGDGDWAKEGLAFGAMIENSYWGIFRVWSRAWLVTK
jgi:hypothetical protein